MNTDCNLSLSNKNYEFFRIDSIDEVENSISTLCLTTFKHLSYNNNNNGTSLTIYNNNNNNREKHINKTYFINEKIIIIILLMILIISLDKLYIFEKIYSECKYNHYHYHHHHCHYYHYYIIVTYNGYSTII